MFPDNKSRVKRLLTAAANGDLTSIRRVADEMSTTGQVDPAVLGSICHSGSGDTMLHIAARHGHVDILRYFHEEIGCTNFERTNVLGKTALHEAAQSSQLNCIEFLTSVVRVALDCLKLADWTPLMLSCTRDHLGCVQCLVRAGAALRPRNKDGWTAFHVACRYKQRVATVTSREGHEHIVSYLLQCEPNLWNTVSNNGRTPLHTAALHSCVRVVGLLLRAWPIPRDERDGCGTTPAMDAARADQVTVLEMLVAQHQADVYATDKMGRQALHLAAQAGSTRAVSYLIEKHGVNPNVQAGAGITALHLACKEGQDKVVEILFQLGADINLRDEGGRTALQAAITGRRFNCVKILTDRGAL